MAVIPSEALKLKTPFAFAISILPQVSQALLNDVGATDSTGQTALGFLKFMSESSTIFLQDAAAMMISKPERRDHPLFRRLGCFEGADWDVSFVRFFVVDCCFLAAFLLTLLFSQNFVDKMKIELTNADIVSPLNHSVEVVLPGLHQRWAQTHNFVTGVKEHVKMIRVEMKESVTCIKESSRSQKELLSDFLVKFGESLRENPPRGQVSVPASQQGPMEEASEFRPPNNSLQFKAETRFCLGYLQRMVGDWRAHRQAYQRRFHSVKTTIQAEMEKTL